MVPNSYVQSFSKVKNLTFIVIDEVWWGIDEL